MSSVKLLPNALSELFAQASTSGCLTIADCYGLRAALLEDSLSEEERAAINRLLQAVRQGRIHLMDEISAETKLYTLVSPFSTSFFDETA